MSNQVSSSLDRVVSSISTAKIKMKNISIRLTNAAEDQYIENRVQKPPQIQDDTIYKTRRKNRNQRVRQLIMQESQIDNTQIGRMRMAVQMAIEKLSFKQNEDLVSMGESDSVSKHASVSHPSNRSTFQLRLPPCIGDAKFATSKYLGLTPENLDIIQQQADDDTMSRNSQIIYRSGGSVIHLPPENNPGMAVNAIPSLNSVPVGSAASAIPIMNQGRGAPPPPPPPPPPPAPPAGLNSPGGVQPAMTMSDQLAKIGLRQPSEVSMIGQEISREPSFMMDTQKPADLQSDIYKLGTFGTQTNVQPITDQQQNKQEQQVPEPKPVKLSKKEQKKKQKEQKERAKLQKKRLKQQSNKNKKSAIPTSGNAVPKISKTALPPPTPPPPPPPAQPGRPVAQTIKKLPKGKTLTIQEQLAMRKSTPAKYATTSTKATKKKKQQSYLPPAPVAKASKKDSIVSMKDQTISQSNQNDQTVDMSVISVGMPFQRGEAQKQEQDQQKLPAFGGGGDFLQELKKNLGKQVKQSKVKNDSDDSSSSSSGKQSQSQEDEEDDDDNDDDQNKEAQKKTEEDVVQEQRNIRAPSMPKKQEQMRNYSQVSSRAPQQQSAKDTNFKDNLAKIFKQQQQSSAQSNPRPTQAAPTKQNEDNNWRHQTSAPPGLTTNNDWRQSKRQLNDLFGSQQTQGSGFLGNDIKKSDTFGAGGMFDFQGQQEQPQAKLKNTKN